MCNSSISFTGEELQTAPSRLRRLETRSGVSEGGGATLQLRSGDRRRLQSTSPLLLWPSLDDGAVLSGSEAELFQVLAETCLRLQAGSTVLTDLFTLATGRSYRRSGRQLKYLAASYSAAAGSASATVAAVLM